MIDVRLMQIVVDIDQLKINKQKLTIVRTRKTHGINNLKHVSSEKCWSIFKTENYYTSENDCASNENSQSDVKFMS